MICSIKSSVPVPALSGSDSVSQKRIVSLTQRRSSLSPSLPQIIPKFSLSVTKPLHVSSVSSFEKPRKSLVTCKAFEADKSQPIEGSGVAKSETARKIKIGIYFATWWALNVVFNIYNKKVLNAFPYPWLTSTLSLACGSLMMLISWATRIAETPKTDLEFWKTLLPVSESGLCLVDEKSGKKNNERK